MKEESSIERLCEALALESRCLLALLRLGCELAEAERLLAWFEMDKRAPLSTGRDGSCQRMTCLCAED